VRRSGPHSKARDILISILGHSGPSLYGSGASRVPIDRLAEAPLFVARPEAVSAPPCATNSRARGARAVLADQNGLLGWPKVTEAARLPSRGIERQATNLRVYPTCLLIRVSIGATPQLYDFVRIGSGSTGYLRKRPAAV
jgi:hypothetical protein